MPAASPPGRADALDRIRDLIEADGRQLREIAAAADMSAAQLYQIRAGVRENPALGTIAAILRGLGKTWGDLDQD